MGLQEEVQTLRAALGSALTALANVEAELSELKALTTFDFKDGNGPVPAHRHHRGGGWVAESATVSRTAFVGPNARVFGQAQVLDRARIEGFGDVRANATIRDAARVTDNASVFGSATVSDQACVKDEARVFGTAHVRMFTSVTDRYWVNGTDLGTNFSD